MINALTKYYTLNWVFGFSQSSSEILESGLEWVIQQERSPKVNLEELEWSPLSQQTIETYQDICNFYC